MTLRPSGLFLHTIAYDLGAVTPIEALGGDELPPGAAQILTERGVQGFSRIADIDTALRQVVLRCFARSGRSGADIDTVLFLSETFGSLFATGGRGDGASFLDVRNRVFQMLAELGIRRASVSSVTYGGCTNLLQAVSVARSLARDGSARAVLLVAGDRFGSVSSRFMPDAITMCGDGVAACLLTVEKPRNEPSYRILRTSAAPYLRVERSDTAGMLLEMFKAMKIAAAECYDGSGRQPRDFRWVLLGNYNPVTSTTFGKLLGFDAQRIFLNDVGRRGHTPFDPLINLADLTEAALSKAGDELLIFLCGPLSCGSIALSAVQPSRRRTLEAGRGDGVAGVAPRPAI